MPKGMIGKREGDYRSPLFFLLARCQESSIGTTGTQARKTKQVLFVATY